MFRTYIVVAFLITYILNLPDVKGQHCPPIYESYLESITIKHVKDGIALNIDYKKSGGQTKDAYQAYVLAYSHFDTDKLLELSPQEAIEAKVVSVVHTQLAKRQESGCYGIQCLLKTHDLVETMLKDSKLDLKQVEDSDGWKVFKGRVRLAVFIPFLDDKKFSTIDGSPEKKHECNYYGEDGLIFETLPHTLTVHFGIVQAFTIPDGEYYIEINGNRPVKKAKKEIK